MKLLLAILMLYSIDVFCAIVLIDPGHGGLENGAVGPDISLKDLKIKVREKEISFKMAKKIQEKLIGKHQVYLTRSYDKTLTLEQRAELAQKLGADIFVSVHANSSRSPKSNGFETFYLSNNDNEAVKKVVRLENNEHTHKFEADYSDNPMIHQMLSELVVGQTVPLSKKLGETIHNELKQPLERKFKMKDRGLKPGLFFVLAMSKVPGVLLEMGFLSNKKEAQKIYSEEFLDKYSSAVAKGINQFFTKK